MKIYLLKMGNIAPRAETYISYSLHQWLTITPSRLSGVTNLPTPICLCAYLPKRSVQTTTYYRPEITSDIASMLVVISGWVLNCDIAHSWCLYSVILMGDQALNVMPLHPIQSDNPETEPNRHSLS